MSSPHRRSIDPPPLEVIREGFLEAVIAEDAFESFLDAEDHHGHFQAGVHYRFSQGKRVADGRRYDDHPGEVSLYLSDAPAYIPYYDPFLASIVQHLRAESPTPRIRLLCRNGYRDIDVDRLLTHQGPGWRFVGWFWGNPKLVFILFALIVITALLRALSLVLSP